AARATCDSAAADPAGRTLVLRTETQPTGKVLHRWKSAYIRPDLTEQHQGRCWIDAFQHRQIDARHPVQHVLQSKRWFVDGFRASSWPTWAGSTLASICERCQAALQLAIAPAQLLSVKSISLDRLSQGEQMLHTPVAVQGSRNLRFGTPALVVAQFGQLQRIALAAQDRLDDGHAGDAGDVADHLGQLDIHL